MSVSHLPNPRIEAEQHYYNARHSKLLALGLRPHLLRDELVNTMLVKIRQHADDVDRTALVKGVSWMPRRGVLTPVIGHDDLAR